MNVLRWAQIRLSGGLIRHVLDLLHVRNARETDVRLSACTAVGNITKSAGERKLLGGKVQLQDRIMGGWWSLVGGQPTDWGVLGSAVARTPYGIESSTREVALEGVQDSFWRKERCCCCYCGGLSGRLVDTDEVKVTQLQGGVGVSTRPWDGMVAIHNNLCSHAIVGKSS